MRRPGASQHSRLERRTTQSPGFAWAELNQNFGDKAVPETVPVGRIDQVENAVQTLENKMVGTRRLELLTSTVSTLHCIE
jgi:hypothetical protein